jgi:hypothetical protein
MVLYGLSPSALFWKNWVQMKYNIVTFSLLYKTNECHSSPKISEANVNFLSCGEAGLKK